MARVATTGNITSTMTLGEEAPRMWNMIVALSCAIDSFGLVLLKERKNVVLLQLSGVCRSLCVSEICMYE